MNEAARVAGAIAMTMAVTTACGGSATSQGATGSTASVHWTYSGAEGPDHWADLAPQFGTCRSGKSQSPIDLRPDGPSAKLMAPVFGYTPVPLRLVDNGHVVQVNAKDTSSLTFNDVRYELRQFHFHVPAEHTVAGRTFDAEMHLVHANAQKRNLVIALLFTKGKDNDLVAPVIAALPKNAPKEDPSVTIDLSKLLPPKTRYLHYIGSLTSPPCTEDVEWLVVSPDAGLEMSEAQIAALKDATHGATSRAIQPANGRAANVIDAQP